MTKRKKLQHSLWLTVALTAMSLFYAPILHIPLYRAVAFWMLVFLPQVIAIILQFCEVCECYVDMVADSAEKQYGKLPKKTLRIEFISVYITTYALLKSQGINPNRAGPVLCV